MTSRVLLIWRCRTLGDPILGIPLLRALRARYPDARLTVVGYPHVWDLAGTFVDEVASIVEPPYDALLGTSPPAGFPDMRDVELAVSLTSLPVGPMLRNAGVRRVVERSPWPPPGIHVADWLAGAIRSTLSSEPEVPTLSPTTEEYALGKRILSQLGLAAPIILHPGSSEAWKRWPAARYARLADALQRSGHQVAIVAGAADRDAAAFITAHARTRPLLVPPMGVRSLKSMLANAALFIGNDSGVTHLAAAVGAPAIALFGPTDPDSWAPRGRVQVIRACRRRVAGRGQIRVCDDPRCLEGIDVDAVIREVHAHATSGYLTAGPAVRPRLVFPSRAPA